VLPDLRKKIAVGRFAGFEILPNDVWNFSAYLTVNIASALLSPSGYNAIQGNRRCRENRTKHKDKRLSCSGLFCVRILIVGLESCKALLLHLTAWRLHQVPEFRRESNLRPDHSGFKSQKGFQPKLCPPPSHKGLLQLEHWSLVCQRRSPQPRREIR